jgi:hypothetical protein
MRWSRYLFAAVLWFGITSSAAAQGPGAAKLMITPHEARVEPGQGLQFHALLFDNLGMPIRIDKIAWSVAPDSFATISDDGFFMAGRRDGEVKVLAQAQAGSNIYPGEARVTIGRGPALPVRIIVEPNEAVVPPLGTQQFKAFIATPNTPPQPAMRAKWDLVPNTLGKIEPNTGLFTAGNNTGFGTVIAFVDVNGAVLRGEARVIVAATTAAITGNVKDQKTGAAIAKAAVWADYIGPFRFVRRAETDAQGNYLIEKLIPGLYVVRSEAREYLPEFYKEAALFEQSTPVRLADNETKKDINFTLSPGATISGLVKRDSDGAPLPGAHVVAILVVRPDLKHHAVADDNGNYAINPLPKGTYAVFAEAAGYKAEFYKDKRDLISADHVSVQDEEKAGDIDFSLATASAISGKVVDAVSKQPIAKALVTIHTLIAPNRSRPVFNVLTDDNGEYIANAAPGFYVVSAEVRGFHLEFFEEARELIKAKPVQVFQDKHTTNINFTMDKLAAITGMVTDEVTKKPIAGAIVTAFQERPPTPDPFIGKDELRQPLIAKTDSLGNYKLEGVRPGKYFVLAAGRGYLPEYWKEAAKLQDATAVDVAESGNVDHIDFTLALGGAIAGKVLAATDQRPIAGALVQIFMKTNATIPFARGLAERDGKYRIDGLPTGEYLVFASAEGFTGLYYKDVEQRQHATPVKVQAPNETIDIDFHLKPFDRRGGTVAGTITSEADKNPIPHALVLLISLSAPGNMALYTMADDFGKYKIAGVPTGKYVAVAFAPHFLSEFYENAQSFREAKIFSVDNNVVDNINFTLTPSQRGPYQIVGRVRQRNQNRGAENAVVQVLDDGVVIATAISGDDGNFILEEIPAGEFKVSATSTLGDAEQQVPVSLGNGRSIANVELTLGTTSVKDATAEIPIKFDLEQNFPNPFNPETSIKYHLPARTNVTLRIYNALGQEVRTLVNALQDAGVYNANWDGKDNNGRQLTTGLYLIRLDAGDFVMTRKMAMVK